MDFAFPRPTSFRISRPVINVKQRLGEIAREAAEMVGYTLLATFIILIIVLEFLVLPQLDWSVPGLGLPVLIDLTNL